MKRKIIPDIYISLIYMAILISGMVAIYGAETIHNPETSLFFNHIKLMGFMLLITLIMIILPDGFELLDRMVPILLLITVVLLIAVLIFGITVEGSYAKRWLLLAPGFTIQPSEIAKVTFAIYLASVLSKKGEKLFNFRKGLVPPLLVLLAISFLIMIEPDSGTAMLFSIVGFAMFFYAGIPLRSLILSGVLLMVIFIIFIFNVPYMKNRVTAYFEPGRQSEEDTYQIKRAKLAFNYGGVAGISDDDIKEVSTHLPAALTDFIYASIAQKFGFIGDIIVLMLFLSFTVRGFIISIRLKNLFLKYLSFGITMFISIQGYLNMMVATLIIPTTGMPLPFISYGRNALVINMIMMAILLKITQRIEE